ncbi:MAG: hypothetical protein HDR14_13895 [Lachnospiraceae bacterium]|nr:hypothetical protein [Lachnospiraceae bacterium]
MNIKTFHDLNRQEGECMKLEAYFGSDIATINLEEAISEYNRNRRPIARLDNEYEEER